MDASRPTRHVGIVLDVACGWSYLGFTRLRRAVREYRETGGAVELTFRPFQLDPSAGRDGERLVGVLHERFGPQVDEHNARFVALAARDGLDIHFERAVHANTFDAHRLIHRAAGQGLAEPMVERLFRAHYTDGFNLADPAVLDRLAADLGVIGPGMSDDDSGAAHVRSELAAVRREGVTGVPVFIVDGRALSGAQSQDVLLRALQRSA